MDVATVGVGSNDKVWVSPKINNSEGQQSSEATPPWIPASRQSTFKTLLNKKLNKPAQNLA